MAPRSPLPHLPARALAALFAAWSGAAPGAQEPALPPPGPGHGAAQEPVHRLASATSPYLRQHAADLVDWYPWGEEALARSRAEQKPIFLSIGYSACHWCHVMARESFRDPGTARSLNADFVCILVDREERPDLDEIYLAALAAMGQQGGWPMSLFLTPEQQPIFGGTYFPPADAHGRPGFRRVVERVAAAWREDRQQVQRGAGELAAHLRQALAPELPPGEVTPALLDGLLAAARAGFDREHGGFGEAPHWAPKFPQPGLLRALLRLPDAEAAGMARTTLEHLAAGGICDQLGGGFHRYSTDRAWRVPHFEKMLGDNAQLATCYLEAYARTGEAGFAAVARATLDWLLRELRDPGGGFRSSLDAVAGGAEGQFFVWRLAEFTAAAGADAAVAARHFGVTAAGNWQGANVLAQAASAAAIARELDRPAAEVAAAIVRARAALLAARERRARPAVDDKVLCAWNGLAIEALATGYAVLGEVRYREAAAGAADFVLRELVREGRCLRSWHAGQARHRGVLEDHALLADGLVALFEVDPDPRWLHAARDLLRQIAARFSAGAGGLHATADDHEPLLARTRNAAETAQPSGMAAAARAALRAGLLLGDERLYELGADVLRANRALLERAPVAAPSLFVALQFHLADPREVVVAGEPDDPRTQALLRAARGAFPGARVVANVHAGNRAALAALSPVFAGKEPAGGAPAAYVCRRGVCAAPVTDPAALGGGR